MRKNTGVSGSKYKKDIALFASNLGLALFSGIFLILAIAQYQKQIDTVSLAESRFLTVEWHLLQTLKAQTESQLMEKDREISDLRTQFLQLSQSGEAMESLRQIEAQLEQAQKDRERILFQRLSANVPDPESIAAGQEQQAIAAPGSGILPDSEVARLWQSQVKSLETQTQEYLRIILSSRQTIGEQAIIIADQLQAIRSAEAEIKRRSAMTGDLLQALRAAQSDLRQKAGAIGNQNAPSVEALNSRVLVRALLNSQGIRTEYPNLLKGFDSFIEQYGSTQRAQGAAAAYREALLAIDALINALGTP